MNRSPHLLKLAMILLFVFILTASTVSGSPVQAAGRLEDDRLYPGIYNGTFVFTIAYAFDAPTAEMPVNSFSLQAEEVLGSIRFRANEDGAVEGVDIRIPGFKYRTVGRQSFIVPEGSQGEWNYTGNYSKAIGVGTASGGSGLSGARPLSPTRMDFWTRPIKFDAGDPAGFSQAFGKNVPPGPDPTKKWLESVRSILNDLPASPWTFAVTWAGPQSASGTCSTESWTTANRSITCYWAAYSGGYKRLTAPGPDK